LHLAARGTKQPEVILALLQAGANVMAQDEDGETPMHCASRNNNPAIIRILLDFGGDVMGVDYKGLTPLHIAAIEAMTPEIIQMLLNAGADKKVKDKNGRTPFYYAQENEYLKFNKGHLVLRNAN
jgi:ankyrin repeat protein